MGHRLLAAGLVVQEQVDDAGAAPVLPDFRRRVAAGEHGLAENGPDLQRRQPLEPAGVAAGSLGQGRLAAAQRIGAELIEAAGHRPRRPNLLRCAAASDKKGQRRKGGKMGESHG